MDFLISFAENLTSPQRTMILVGGIVFFWILEGFFPIRFWKYNKLKHAGPNLFFTVTTAVINLGFAFLIVGTAETLSAKKIGLLYLLDLPLWLFVLLGIMILDFVGAYLIHWTEHKVYWMWKFHVVHHSDEHVDTTTALRHHPGESVFRATFTLLAIAITGAPGWMVILYQSISAIMSQFNHSNLKMPAVVDKAISYLFVTPGMHRVHHHFEQPYSDVNYGNIFAIWDRLLGTYAFLPDEEIIYGVDVYDQGENNLSNLLKVPFDKGNYHRETE